MTPLSQRDPRWANEVLGTQGTIGNLGCTITALACLLGKTPSQINQALKAVNGYSNGNLVTWSRLPLALPQIKSAERVWSYDNEKVKQAILANGGCLVEVDGTRIGASKHWVLYIGNGQMIDPWYGTIKATSYYAPIGFAVITVQSIQENMSDQISIPKTTFEELVGKATKYDYFISKGFNNAEDVINKIGSLEEQLGKKQDDITTLKGEVAEKASALKEVRDQLNSLMETLATKLTTIVDRSEIIGAVDRLLSGEHEMLKKVNKLEKAYALLEDEKKLEIEALKRELEQLRLVNEAQAKHLERLGEKIDTVVEETKKTRTLYDVLKDFLNKFVETRED